MKHARWRPSHGRLRKEHDPLGPVEVPTDAWYGAQTQRAIENFPISGRRAKDELILALLQVKRAAALANREAGKIDAKRSDLILRAIDELSKGWVDRWDALFPVDPFQAGAGTSQNMNLNEVIANVANTIAGSSRGRWQPVHPNDHVNASQSTNDVYPTALRIALLGSSRQLLASLHGLSETLLRHAESWQGLLKSGRTHLQDAVPVRLGHEFAAYSRAITRCTRWIEAGRNGLRELGIGGSAVGNGINVPMGYAEFCAVELARVTGETLHSAEDLSYVMQSQAVISMYMSSLRGLAIELTRICNDLRLMSSGPMNGLGEILLPAVQPGSSIMPGKVNPSILEMVNQVCFSVQGHDHTVALAAQAGQLELNVMMPVMAESSLEATRILASAVKVLDLRCVRGILPNEERLKHSFENTAQVATALTPHLGYEKVTELVNEAISKGRSVLDVAREKKLVSEEDVIHIRSRF